MRSARLRRLFSILAVLLLAATACTEADLELSSNATGGDGDGRRGLPDPADLEVEVPEDLEVEALNDVEAYWEEEFPEIYGSDFEPVDGGFIPYGPDTEVPDCGPQELDYETAQNNAFYCTFDDYIAWDDVGLLATVEEDYGPLAVGVIMAHEYGHAVQERIDVFDQATIITELQADCFAGAWASDVNGRIPYFSSDNGALVASIAAFVELLRDAPGSSKNSPTAHGSAFDRISAFQNGYDEGASACATYVEDPPVLTQMPFRPGADQASGGNLPTDELFELLPEDIESFYTALFDSAGEDWDPLDNIELVDPDRDSVHCDDETLTGDELEYLSAYCPDDDTIYFDAAELLPDLEDIGDMAVGGELARLYAVKAQHDLGISGSEADLTEQADCLTGVYIAAMFNEAIPGQQLLLSGGDLDEIVIVFLVFAEGSDESSPVDRIGDFRDGFLEGSAACEDLF